MVECAIDVDFRKGNYMKDNDNRSELKIAWDNFKTALKQEQPFKFIYEMMIKLIELLASKLK